MLRRSQILYKLQLVLAILDCGYLCAGEADCLRVITYNVQFLPHPISHKNERPDASYRADRIAEQISNFDLIALQETFHDTYREQMLSNLREAWSENIHSITSPRPNGFFTNGGCVIVSKMRPVANHAMVFKNFSKPIDYGLRADGFAAKGVIHARIKAEQHVHQFIDVFVTHLEARADDLRPMQYVEVANFIKKHSRPESPALLMGDLNTQGSEKFRNDPNSQYSRLMEQLAMARPKHPWIDVWAYLRKDSLGGTTEQESSDIGKRIDYVLLSNPAETYRQLIPVSVKVMLFQDKKVTALSDHNGVAAELEWR